MSFTGIIDNINFSELEAEKYWTPPKTKNNKEKKELARNLIFSDNYVGAVKKDGAYYRFIKDENGERTGPYRVYMKNSELPGLAMSRSFGDKKAKSCGVIPYPDIIEYNLKGNIKYMVICSDGVWEFLSNEEVMDIGDKYFYQNDINEFCTQLLKRSTEIWEKEECYMDDITIVVVFF